MSEISVYDAADLRGAEWARLQSLARESFGTSDLPRTQREISDLVDWNDPERFYASHADPNTEVGQRYSINQSFAYPRVAVATNEDAEPIGYAYAAHNVSGATEDERWKKMIGVSHNYFWLREVVVLPDYRRQGVARALVAALLSHANSAQPVSTYIWPDEIPFLDGALTQIGFTPTGEQHVTPFGDQNPPTRQVRMQAASAGEVLRLLTETQKTRKP